jgi:TusA-related sulfurtransferase
MTMQLTIDASQPIDFHVMAGSPAAQKEAGKIIAEIQAAQRGETLAINSQDPAIREKVTALANAFTPSNGAVEIAVAPIKNERQNQLFHEAVQGEGFKPLEVMGKFTSQVVAANNIVPTNGFASRATPSGSNVTR